jgi:hypothetical protein
LYHRQVRVLGLVFNAVPPKSVTYYYYKYKDYYRPYGVVDKKKKDKEKPVEIPKPKGE